MGVGFFVCLFCFSLYTYDKKMSVFLSMDETHLLEGLYQDLEYFLCVLTKVAVTLFPYGL